MGSFSLARRPETPNGLVEKNQLKSFFPIDTTKIQKESWRYRKMLPISNICSLGHYVFAQPNWASCSRRMAAYSCGKGLKVVCHQAHSMFVREIWVCYSQRGCFSICNDFVYIELPESEVCILRLMPQAIFGWDCITTDLKSCSVSRLPKNVPRQGKQKNNCIKVDILHQPKATN